MDVNWFCPEPHFVPKYGATSTSWQNLRHVRFKRQLPYDSDVRYKSQRYKYEKDFNPYDYIDRIDRYGSHSGYGHHTGYGSHSGYGHHESYDYHECCPLVVDPLILCALLGLIAAATYFLRIQITMNMNIVGRKRRRKRSGEDKTLLINSSHSNRPDIVNTSNSSDMSTESDEVVMFSFPYFSNIFHQGNSLQYHNGLYVIC